MLKNAVQIKVSSWCDPTVIPMETKESIICDFNLALVFI